MARLGYIDKIQDPTSNSDYYEIVDSVAREQLAFKTEKKYVNSLPAKPTSKTGDNGWDTVKKYIYFVPIDGAIGDDIYEEWTLFFIGDESVASDYTDPDNYRYEKIGTTATDISNFSTKGHTHEVITEVGVEDHNYTPQGTVDSTFTGNENTTDTYTHNHSYKPEGQVSSTFTGNPSTTTDSSTTGVSLNKSSKKLSTKKLKLESASVSLSPSTTTVAKNTFAANSGSYEADKSIFNGISVTDGVLSFVTKKLDTATSVTGVTGSTTATKVTFGGNVTTEEDVATGAVESGSQLLGNDTGITDSGHTHTVTPLGSVSSTFTGSNLTTNNDSHSHAVTPTGTIKSSFNGLRANLKHKVDNKKVRTSPDQEDEGSHAFEWYGIEFDEAGTDPIKTRVGNLDMHKMLPIQTKMRRCILNDNGTVNYYLDDRDSTKRAGSQEGWVTSEETFVNKIETSELRDETETIEKIEGKSCAWNQLVDNDYIHVYGTTDENKVNVGVAGKGFSIISGHKYVLIMSLNKSYNYNLRSTTDSYTKSLYYTDGISFFVAEDTVNDIFLQVYGFAVGENYDFYTNIFDLTLMGIDSFTTIEQVEAYLAKNFGQRSYYPYNAGELLSYGGKMVKWNQLVDTNTTSVSTTSGHKYYTIISGTKSVVTSAGSAIAVTGGTDMVFDLTLMFGAGSEPTLEECEKIFVNDYYPYNAGENKNLIDESGCGTGWKTVGFNKWDEEWELGSISTTGGDASSSIQIRSKNYVPVFPLTQYYFYSGSAAIGRVCYYDANKNFVSVAYPTENTIITTHAGAYFMRFVVGNGAPAITTYNHDICINISDPSRNGEYEPYQEHNYPQQITKWTGINSVTGEREVMFPNGMKWADAQGTVKDMLYRENGVTKAYKPVDDVDLGSLNWTAQDYGFSSDEAPSGIKSYNVYTIPFVLSAKFITTNYYGMNEAVLKDKGYISITTNGKVATNSTLTDAVTFKASLDGTYLNYALATPITYTDIQDENGSPVILPIEMEVEHNDTISLLPEVTTTQVTAAPTLTMKKYVLTQGANLDGSDGQVMVEIPEHWRKVYTYLNGSATMVRAMISPYSQDGTGWIHINKGYISAYEAAIVNNKLCSISNVKPLIVSGEEQPIYSVVNGKVNAQCDVTGASGQSDITSQLPTTSVTMDTLRTAARARSVVSGETNWNQLVYEQYLTICWLYYIEYANLNCQDPFTTALDMNGYHQGGLGNGVTTINGTNWNTFNGYRPFVPCGITNCLGNQSGEVLLALPSTFGTNVKVAVPSYRGIENIFGHIWKFADGIKYLGDGSVQSVLRCDNPANYSSASASTNYTSIGNNYGGDGWKKKIMIGDDGDINCKAVGGGSNQAYCDYNYQAHTSGTYYCCLLGGGARNGADAGLGYVSSYVGVGRSDTNIGSRLSYFNK